MNKQASLTPASADALHTGSLKDSRVPGLSLKVTGTGKKSWVYRRRVASSDVILKLVLGNYPVHTIADARKWAMELNEKVEAGINPMATDTEHHKRSTMTVADAHELYMAAVREGRASRAKKINKPRTIDDKLSIYASCIKPAFAKRLIFEIQESDLTAEVLKKGKTAKTRANRMAAELKVFFGWASSLRGGEVGLTVNPALRLSDLKFPERKRGRSFSLEEIGWFLRSLVEEDHFSRRGLLLLLLTATRRSELLEATATEIEQDIWTVPGERTKNGLPHRIALGPWCQSLIRTNYEWVFPSEKVDGPRVPIAWYQARDRVCARMATIADKPVLPWTLHDLRRTARSNTKRLGIDYETAEAMLNHSKRGLERIYDKYDLEDEKRDGFLKWENEVARIAAECGVADALGVPVPPTKVAATLPMFTPRHARSFARQRYAHARRGR